MICTATRGGHAEKIDGRPNVRVFINCKTYDVSWNGNIIDIRKADGETNIQHQMDGKSILYFRHNDEHVGVDFRHGKPVKAWRRPAEDPHAKYEDYRMVPKDVKEAALAVFAEMKDALAEAERKRKL
mgnify:CR=1 FL=1